MGIAAGSLVALLFRLSGMFLWGIIGVLTARLLTVEERGVYASAIILSSAIGGISSFASATGYFVANRKRLPAEVAANAALMAGPLGVLLVTLGGIVGLALGGGDGAVVILAAASMAPVVLRNTLIGVLIGTNQIVRYNVAVHAPIAGAFALIALWVGFLDHRSAAHALAAWAVAQYASLALFLPWGREWWAWVVRHRPDTALMKAMVRFTLVTGTGGIIGLLNYRADQVLVITLDSKEGAGIYSSAIAVAEGLWLFSSAIALASYARVGRVDRTEAARVTATGVRHTLMVVVLGGIAAAWLGPPLVELLFGSPYRGATEPLRILCIGTALFAPQGLMANYFVNQLGRPGLQLGLACLSLVISVGAGFLLIPPFGTSGAAWSTTISYGVSMLVATVLFCRLAGISHRELWRIRRSDVAAYFQLARDILSGRFFRASMRAERTVASEPG